MRVGVDVDGPLYPFVDALREWLVATAGIDPADLPDPDRQAFHEVWPITKAEFTAACHAATDAGHLMVSGDPLPGSRAALERLHADGHSIHIVTHRWHGRKPSGTVGSAAAIATRWWLNQHQLPYDTIDFVTGGSKAVVPTDVFIDDHLDNYDDLEKAGVHVVLFDAPYNQDDGSRRRVRTLGEFADVVRDLAAAA